MSTQIVQKGIEQFECLIWWTCLQAWEIFWLVGLSTLPLPGVPVVLWPCTMEYCKYIKDPNSDEINFSTRIFLSCNSPEDEFLQYRTSTSEITLRIKFVNQNGSLHSRILQGPVLLLSVLMIVMASQTHREVQAEIKVLGSRSQVVAKDSHSSSSPRIATTTRSKSDVGIKHRIQNWIKLAL